MCVYVCVCVCIVSVCVCVVCVYVGTWLRACIVCAHCAVIMEEGVWLTSIVVPSTEQDIIYTYIWHFTYTALCCIILYIHTTESMCLMPTFIVSSMC